MRSIITLLLLTMMSQHINAQEITIGKTWEIQEPDPIKLAKNRAKTIPKERLKPKSSFRKKLSAKGLFRTITPKQRTYTPTHVLDREIMNKDGKVLYAKGFKFNPIQYMRRYKNRIVIIDQQDALTVKDKLLPSDIVIVYKGDLKNTAEVLDRRVDMLDLLTAESMDIKRIPVIVTVDYENYRYELLEFNPEIGVPL
ncbi:hypothetical protein [Thalassotalea marina]|uniref:Uncharacterized protein n=1 Tax=Thalassotalea marina TaxID=1673741 RepID=A0A919EQ79_9GAMM|nr:hypothetical protein [Thalassotalea marina]GHG07102.1 hypothetical protein GCM10017161_40940 [Thalassotalea marina]